MLNSLLTEILDGSLFTAEDFPTPTEEERSSPGKEEEESQISLGLDWPNRVPGVGAPLDWTTASTWTFEPLDTHAFPAVDLAKRVGRAGGTYPAVFNAANEQAVIAFHAGQISYLDIVEIVAAVVDAHSSFGDLTRDSLAEAELWARAYADQRISSR